MTDKNFGPDLPLDAQCKFGQLSVTKILKIIANRCHILRLKCTISAGDLPQYLHDSPRLDSPKVTKSNTRVRVRERILFKRCLMVYRALSGLTSYITELCVPVASIRPRSSLWSAAHDTLFVPRTRLELGKRAFAVAAPSAWNSLPGDVRERKHLTNLNSA